MAERNEKGHFAKGNTIGKDTRFKRAQDADRKQTDQEIQRMGGHARQIQKREQRTLAEMCNMIGSIDASASDKDNLRKLGIDPETANQATQDFVVAAAQYMRAKSGDTKAAKWIRDTKGESVVNVNMTDTPIQVVDFQPTDE